MSYDNHNIQTVFPYNMQKVDYTQLKPNFSFMFVGPCIIVITEEYNLTIYDL